MGVNTTGTVVSIGLNCFVKAGESAASAKVIGFATEASYNESFQTQKCEVLGHYGPVSIDPQSYDCQITISAFVPSAVLLASTEQQYKYPDGKTDAISIFDLMPSRSSIADNKEMRKIGYLAFVDGKGISEGDKNGKVLASFSGVVITSDGMQLSPNSYTRSNVQMMALERNTL